MASATESDVRAQLPNDIEDQPSSSEISDKLDDAADKVDKYDDLTTAEVKKAEKYWAAYLLLDLQYQKPVSSSEAGVDQRFEGNPAQRLLDKFNDVVGSHIIRVV